MRGEGRVESTVADRVREILEEQGCGEVGEALADLVLAQENGDADARAFAFEEIVEVI